MLALLGVVLFCAFAGASLPARLVFDAIAGPFGARAGLVQGTLWDATLLRLSIGAPPIAETTARLRPGGLLGGAARFDVAMRDATLRLDGLLSVTPGGIAIEDASGVIALSRLPLAASVPPGQSFQLDIERLALDRQGRCMQAQGRLRTAALVAAGESLGTDLLVLEGALLCAGDQVAIQLEGENEQIAVSGRVRFEAQGPQWRIEARSSQREIVAVLSLLGFVQEGPGAFVLDSARLDQDS